VKCTCLNRVGHSKGSSNLLSRRRVQGLDLRGRERERGDQDWILGRVLLFLSGPRSKGIGGGLFIVPTKIEPLGGRIHQTCLVRGSDKSSERL
jgi:hypothetical protein